MRTENKRIFIRDLPETVTESEIKDAFQDYGNVVSVEIKTRKELGTQHISLHFGYVNLETDDHTLRQCFKDFSNQKWHNQYVMLQLARESFLERLKRERETKTNSNTPELSGLATKPEIETKSLDGYANSIKTSFLNKISSVESEEEEEQEEEQQDEKDVTRANSKCKSNIDIVIKDNRGKVLNKNGLKIPSFGNDPIVRIEKTKKNVENKSEANLKRLQSLRKLKSQYQDKKSLIKAALSNVDSKPKNKIIFDDIKELPHSAGKGSSKEKNSRHLFDELEDDNFEADFSVKEQFEGLEGKKLLQLQSKYKHDKRFMLDSRFLEKSKIPNGDELENDEDMTMQDEKKKEYEILNEILGKNVTPKSTSGVESMKKSMLRFDPSEPQHTKFEVQKVAEKVNGKKELQLKLLEDKKVEEKEAHTVSKEVFYRVTEDLKDCLQEKEGFSLLNLFGETKERQQDEDNEYEKTAVPVDISDKVEGRNPFQYDSSDDDNDDQTEDILNQESKECVKGCGSVSSGNVRKSFWTESFFFKDDDYRLQEGHDFLEKMRTDDHIEDFSKVRRDLKGIVKAKIRNNQRRNKPFKQKIGGNRKKKFIKMKKAMKR